MGPYGLTSPLIAMRLEKTKSMTDSELIEQLCKDLNEAHDELMRAQGVKDPENHDWPSWTPQANSTRIAEQRLGKRLSKSNIGGIHRVAGRVRPDGSVEEIEIPYSAGMGDNSEKSCVNCGGPCEEGWPVCVNCVNTPPDVRR